MKGLLGRICTILLCAAMILSSSACESGSGKTEAPASAKAVDTVGNGKRVYFAGPLFNQKENGER